MEDNVPGIDLIPEVVHDIFAYGAKGEGEDGKVFRLFQHLPPSVVKTGNEILRLAEDGGAGGHSEGDAHLLGDRFEPALQDGNENLIDADFSHGRILPFTWSSLSLRYMV